MGGRDAAIGQDAGGASEKKWFGQLHFLFEISVAYNIAFSISTATINDQVAYRLDKRMHIICAVTFLCGTMFY